MARVLELIGVSFGYRRDRDILSNISFTVDAGELVALSGESGIGKTTIFRLITGQHKPHSGRILVTGHDVTRMSKRSRLALQRRTVGMIFQQPQLIPELTVTENVIMPALITGESARSATQRAHALLDQCGVDPDIPVNALSGGQGSRVAVARALITQPALVLADEPTASLDDDNAAIVTQLLLDHCHSGGSVLLSTHDQRTRHHSTREITLARTTGNAATIAST